VKGAKGADLLKGVRETTFCAVVPRRHANGGPDTLKDCEAGLDGGLGRIAA
jgi:hypothetical protein